VRLCPVASALALSSEPFGSVRSSDIPSEPSLKNLKSVRAL
jgi:hypothetical protein